MALSKSFPAPKTQELLRVVVSVAVGAPVFALAPFVAPIAPEPFVPVISTPVKLNTVIADTTLCERVAVTLAFVNEDGATARHTSAVPLCAFVRSTSAQVNPPPDTPVTVVFVPLK